MIIFYCPEVVCITRPQSSVSAWPLRGRRITHTTHGRCTRRARFCLVRFVLSRELHSLVVRRVTQSLGLAGGSGGAARRGGSARDEFDGDLQEVQVAASSAHSSSNEETARRRQRCAGANWAARPARRRRTTSDAAARWRRGSSGGGSSSGGEHGRKAANRH